MLLDAAAAVKLEPHEAAYTVNRSLSQGAAQPRFPESPGLTGSTTAAATGGATFGADAAAEAPGPLFAPASALAGQPVTPRAWIVRDLIPAANVTLLGGDGGTGKSTVALQLAVAAALGRAWLRRPVETAGRALFLTAEDEHAELHRRLASICAADGLDMAALSDLFVRSLAGEDALLATPDRVRGVLAPSPLFAALEAEVAAHAPRLVVLDTLADLFGGDENNRGHARQFIALLRGLALRHGCAVVLLAHPSLAGLASGSGSSGSTAWNGSVRSRLYLERIVIDGEEPNPDARRLVTKKANYARAGEEIALTYADGVFVADEPETGLNRMAATAKAERVFLRLLRLHAQQTRYVSHNNGPTFAPAIFAKSPDSEGVTKAGFRTAMEALFAAGKIVVATHGRGVNIRQHIEEAS
jgi:RecA-family ATPase